MPKTYITIVCRQCGRIETVPNPDITGTYYGSGYTQVCCGNDMETIHRERIKHLNYRSLYGSVATVRDTSECAKVLTHDIDFRTAEIRVAAWLANGYSNMWGNTKPASAAVDIWEYYNNQRGGTCNG